MKRLFLIFIIIPLLGFSNFNIENQNLEQKEGLDTFLNKMQYSAYSPVIPYNKTRFEAEFIDSQNKFKNTFLFGIKPTKTFNAGEFLQTLTAITVFNAEAEKSNKWNNSEHKDKELKFRLNSDLPCCFY